MEPSAYKELHESFMVNNNGTTAFETFLVILPSFFTTLIAVDLVALTTVINLQSQLLIEFALIVTSIVLNVTILNNKLYEIVVSYIILTSITVFRQLRQRIHVEPFVQIPSKRPEFINVARGTISLITAICILAVDFQIFPRKYAKTETFGYGLMDVGVGLFVFSNGIIAPEIYHITELSTKELIKKNIINSTPLIIIGMLRFFVTNQIDYQQHISEYGVHWNFFLTLAATKFFGSIIMNILKKPEYSKFAAISIVTLHEMILQLGLAGYVMSDEVDRRTSFLNANREGIVSIPGYVAIYLGSVYIGNVLKSDKDISKARDVFKKSLKVGVIGIILWKIIFICEQMFGVSRRLANMGYVIWVLSIGTFMTALFMLLEIFYYFIIFEKGKADNDNNESKTISHVSYAPIILNAINYNGLLFFIMANLFTGLINIIFQTLLLDEKYSLLIIMIYSLFLCQIMSFLYLNKIKVKFW